MCWRSQISVRVASSTRQSVAWPCRSLAPTPGCLQRSSRMSHARRKWTYGEGLLLPHPSYTTLQGNYGYHRLLSLIGETWQGEDLITGWLMYFNHRSLIRLIPLFLPLVEFKELVIHILKLWVIRLSSHPPASHLPMSWNLPYSDLVLTLQSPIPHPTRYSGTETVVRSTEQPYLSTPSHF